MERIGVARLGTLTGHLIPKATLRAPSMVCENGAVFDAGSSARRSTADGRLLVAAIPSQRFSLITAGLS